MGRHRPDPRGHARVLIAAFAVVLALALLIVGAIALFGAMNSSNNGPATTPTAIPTQSRLAPSPQSPALSAPNAGPHAVVIRVTGPSANVIVANSANTVVLLRGVLQHGEVRNYDATDLVVTVDPAQNVDVEINGKLVSKGKTGKQFFSE